MLRSPERASILELPVPALLRFKLGQQPLELTVLITLQEQLGGALELG